MKEERRGGARDYPVCPGSKLPPSDMRGRCQVCGKLLRVTEGGKVPRHKPLSEVVQKWREDERE